MLQDSFGFEIDDLGENFNSFLWTGKNLFKDFLRVAKIERKRLVFYDD